MKYKPLGNTGLYVSQICLGAMTFSRGDEPTAKAIGATGEALAKQMVDRAFDAGVNFFDTANMYAAGASEEMLGKAIGERRHQAVIATKVFFTYDRSMNALGLNRKAILHEVEQSLRRLGTDYIDLYQVHNFDVTTPLEETLTTLNDLVRSGKVRYIGLSNFTGWQIARAVSLSERLGLEAFKSVQAYYSLVGRQLEYEVLPAARDLGLGVMVWGPLASGFLSGKYHRDGKGEGRRAVASYPPVDLERGHDVVDVLREVADAHQVSPAQVALAWLLHQEGVTSVIVGATKMHQLEDNLKSADLELTSEDLQKLSQVSDPGPLYAWAWPMPRGVTLEDMFSSLS